MNPNTRHLYNGLQVNIGKGYGIPDATQSFTVVPSVEQRLQDKIVEKSSFLPKINVLPVDEMKGQNILGSVTGPIASRTDTSGDGERSPRDILGMDPYEYELYQTNSDVAIKYKTLDVWAKFPDFQARYTNNVQERIAVDREMVGWHGEEAAATTNIVANPMLQDVNKGWMQIMREKKPANVIIEGPNAGEIRIGPGGDYESLDHAVADLKQGIPEYLHKDLIAMIGSDLVGREAAELYKGIADDPTKKLAASASLSKYGGLDWETPSSFPKRGLVITALKNLSIYFQSGKWRRHLKDNPTKDQVEDFNSRNEGYVVENPDAFVALEFKNVVLPAGVDTWD